ncbi:WxL domain-containing protein [Companilactobacillus metriopterae]|uniref:WxL domain-containing protein n=1 Tax=Companilactobacillus metriopterae TaxID=1909267 RepID=UPI00100A3FB0|nr:WxL domain-containing protein [Companilactobacillus metriopterae]
MKKTLIFGAAAALALTTMAPTVASAAVTNSPKTSEADVTLDEGNLDLTKVPSFTFGTINAGVASDLKAAPKDDQLTVTNAGVMTGWNVTVSATAFTDDANTLTLKGAALSLEAGTPTSDSTDGVPTAKAVAINDQENSVFSAAAGQGLGEWVNKLGDGQARLVIPSGSQPGSYKSTLTWTLTDAPA